MPPVGRRGMNVLHGVDLTAGGGRLLKRRAAAASRHRGLHRRTPQRSRPDAAKNHRSAVDRAVAAQLQQHRHRDHREIAVAAGELDEGGAVPGRPGLEADFGDDLVGFDRRSHVKGREFSHRQRAGAAPALDVDRGIERHGHHRQFRRRVEMTQAAADGAPVAGRPVADVAQGLAHEWAAVVDHRGVRQLALPGHGADLDPAALGVADKG